MHSNPLLKWLMIPLVLLLVFVGIKWWPTRAATAASTAPAATLTPGEANILGIEGDTPGDTVATLVAQVKQLRNELRTALNDNKNQKTENERLRARESSIDQRIQTTLDSERTRWQHDRDQMASDRQQTQGLLDDLQRRFSTSADKNPHADTPAGLGLEADDGNAFSGGGGTRWVEPDDAKPAPPSDGLGSRLNLTESVESAQKDLSTAADSLANAGSRVVGNTGSTATPVYTVPANSTLVGSIAMTALIGRVPIDGTVNDPYPFKVLIGPDNLTANGIDIPDVAGAVVSGTASGDWTLACVRGQIRSVTFVFQDGTIRTVPEDTTRPGDDDGRNAAQNGLGWISDPYGTPCVAGERRSNAQQYLGSQALITAAGAGAASLLRAENDGVAMVANNGGSFGAVGLSGDEAMGRVLTGGVRDMADWVNKLYGQAFAAIYVKPGAQVAVHLERSLDIDYDGKGRRVNHRLGEPHVSELD